MQGSYGRAFYGVQGAKGVAAVNWLPLGAPANIRPRIRGGVEAVHSVGTWSAVELSEGRTSAEVPISIAGIEDWAFINQALRSLVTGELPWLSVKWGYAKGASILQYVGIDCKIDTFTLRCDAGGRLTGEATLTGGAVTKTAADPGAMAFFGARMFRDYNLAWSEASPAFDLYGIDVSLRNNLAIDNVILGVGGTRTPDRIWDYLDEGALEVSGEVRYRLGSTALDVQDCLIASGDRTITIATCSDVSPAQGPTVITLVGMKPTDENIDIPDRGNIVIGVPYLATNLTIV